MRAHDRSGTGCDHCYHNYHFGGDMIKRWFVLGSLIGSSLLTGCGGKTATLPEPESPPMETREVASASAVYSQFQYAGETLETVQVGAAEYQNPILAGYYPDPSVLRVGGDFYLVNSSFTHFPGLPIFHSTDLVNWTQIGNAVNKPGQFDFNGLSVSRGIFAPDISFHNGLFYLMSTCVDCGGNFIMTAEHPSGPWSEPTWFDFEGIDPSIYWEGDKAYVLNNGAPNEPARYEGHRAIWIQELDWRALEMVGPRKVLVNGGLDITQKPIWIEGPHIIKKDGFYFLTAAEGGTRDQHSQTIFRSKNLWGPSTPGKQTPILTQRDLDPSRPDPVTSAGHAKFVQLPNGDWWGTFLATRPYGPDEYNIGRETFLLPITWEKGWPTFLKPGEPIPYVQQKPKLPVGQKPEVPTTGNFDYLEAFNQPLGPQWVGIRNPSEPFYNIEGGQLTLSCQNGLGDLDHNPAFIARRLQHHVATISTEMDFMPTADGDRAGMAAVQNDRSWAFIGVEQDKGASYLVATVRDNSDVDMVLAKAPIRSTQDLKLTLRFNGAEMAYEVEQNGKVKLKLEGQNARILSTKVAEGFVGTIVGPYCESQGLSTPTALN